VQYLGGKTGSIKHIVPIINSYTEAAPYLEPFCGGCSVVSRVQAPFRAASDTHPYLIKLLKAVQQGWEPPSLVVSEDEYQDLKARPETHDPAWVALVGFGASFGGKWFGGYAREGSRPFLAEAWRSLRKKMDFMADVHFGEGSYSEYTDLEDMVVYCDPPYAGTTGYSGTSSFDQEAFWQWCREAAKRNTVLVSEFTVPDGCETLWSADRKMDLRAGDGGVRTEKLVRVLP